MVRTSPGPEDLFAATVTVSVQTLLAHVGDMKTVIKAVSALLTVVGKLVVPFDQDLPTLLLVVLAIAEFYLLGLIIQTTTHLLTLLFALVIIFLVASVAYFCILKYMSYEKTVDNGDPGWKLWRKRYKKIRVVGGFRLENNAAAEIKARRITTQKYFEGVAFNEDKVWTRPSRALIQIALILTYCSVILTGCGVIFVIVSVSAG